MNIFTSVLKVLHKRNKVSKPKLPDPIRGHEYSKGIKRARAMFGNPKVIADRSSQAAVVIGSDNQMRSIVYHGTATLSTGALLQLIFCFQHSSDFVFLVRAHKQTPIKFLRKISTEMASSNDARKEYLKEVKAGAFPTNMTTIHGYDLLICGPTRQVVPQDREETLGLHGRIIKYTEYGNVLKSVLYRQPMCTEKIPGDALGNVLDPLWYACPEEILWHWRYYVLPDIKKAYAFWSGIVTKDNLEQLLEMGDVLFRLQNIDKDMYVTAIVRVESNLNKNGIPDFSIQANIFAKLGKFHLRSGKNLRECFDAFVPGAKPTPPWHRHYLLEFEEFFTTIARTLKPIGDTGGDYNAGLIRGQAFLLDSKKRPGIAYIGPSGSGKTTLATYHALQITNNILWIPLKKGEFESSPYWVRDFGGTVIKLDLPDATQLHKRKNSNYQNLQARLQEEDVDYAKQLVANITGNWIRDKKVSGFPFTFDVAEQTVRIHNFYEHFLEAFLKAWEKWYALSHERCLIICDNIIELKKDENHTDLGSIPHDVGKSLGSQITRLPSIGRNMGIGTWLLTHTRSDLEYIGLDYKQMGLEFSLIYNDYTTATVIQPTEGRTLTAELNIRLATPILGYVGQKVLTEEGPVIWTQKDMEILEEA